MKPDLTDLIPLEQYCVRHHDDLPGALVRWPREMWRRCCPGSAEMQHFAVRLIDSVAHLPGTSDTRATIRRRGLHRFPTELKIDHGMLESLWLGTPCTGSVERLAVMRLLKKGLPTPMSIRYIAEQLRRTADTPLICLMLRRFASGDYISSTTIAPPPTRKKIFETSGSVLASEILKRFSNRDIFRVVAEFLVEETIEHRALFHALRPTRRWSTHVMAVRIATNNDLRPRFLREVFGLQLPARGATSTALPVGGAAPPRMSNRDAMAVLSKILWVRTGQAPRNVPLNRDALERAIGMRRLGGCVCLEDLEACGMSLDGMRRLIRSQTNARALMGCVKKLGDADRHVLAWVMTGLSHAARTVSVWRRLAPISGERRPRLVQCQCCLSVCTRFKGDARCVTGHVVLDLFDGQVRCSVCQSTNLTTIDCSLFDVAFMGQAILGCAGCNKLTMAKHGRGSGVLCETCHGKPRLADKTCFCGQPASKAVLCTMDGQLRHIGICSQHEAAVPKTTIVDLRAIIARTDCADLVAV